MNTISNNSENKYRPKIRFWLPEGNLEKNCLVKDIQDIANRGFGGIEVVTENFFNRSVEKGAWNDEQWLQSIETILEQATKLGLSVDISNGLQWPISSPTIMNADDPATLYELTYGVSILNDKMITCHKLPEKRCVRREGTPHLISVQAYRIYDKKTLDFESYIDLTSFVDGGYVKFDFSKLEGNWCIFAFWGQPACQKVGDRIYVIDHLSETGIVENKNYWENHFWSRISKKNVDCIESIFCDSLEYEVSMEWTRDFLNQFSERKKYSLLPFLPVIGEAKTYPKNDVPGYTFTNPTLKEVANNDYLETLSFLYENRHLKPLNTMANYFGKKIRYQVAYNKPFSSESSAAKVDIPENESLGRPTLDNLRTMSGAVHLLNKERYSFECAAEFKNAYGQSQEDLFWWIKRSYMAGINSQVFHGASYSGKINSESEKYILNTTWPGYEAFGKIVSNYWNRTLSVTSMKDFTDVLTQINKIAQKKHQVDLAILRDEYLNSGKGSDGAHLVKDNSILNDHGFSYDFVSTDLLLEFKIAKGHVSTNGIGYKALIIQSKDRISTRTVQLLTELARRGLPIFIVGNNKLEPKFMVDLLETDTFSETVYKLLTEKNVFQVNLFTDLLDSLFQKHIYPSVHFKETTEALSAHCFDENNDYFLFYQYNKVRYDSKNASFDKSTYQPLLKSEKKTTAFEISILATGIPRIYDPISNTFHSINYKYQNGRCHIKMTLDEDEFIILNFSKKYEAGEKRCISHEKEDIVINNWKIKLYSIEKNSKDSISLFDSSYHLFRVFKVDEQLNWWRKLDNSLTNFAGYGLYESEFSLDNIGDLTYLKIPQINDTFELYINEERIPTISRSGIKLILNNVKVGKNKIKLKVFSNLYNRLNSDNYKSYGIQGRLKIENITFNEMKKSKEEDNECI